MNNLAFTWKGRGRDEEAITLMKGSVWLRERVLRLDHPLTSSSLVVLDRWGCENLKSVSSLFRESLTLMTVRGKMHRCLIDTTIFYASFMGFLLPE